MIDNDECDRHLYVIIACLWHKSDFKNCRNLTSIFGATLRKYCNHKFADQEQTYTLKLTCCQRVPQKFSGSGIEPDIKSNVETMCPRGLVGSAKRVDAREIVVTGCIAKLQTRSRSLHITKHRVGKLRTSSSNCPFPLTPASKLIDVMCLVLT